MLKTLPSKPSYQVNYKGNLKSHNQAKANKIFRNEKKIGNDSARKLKTYSTNYLLGLIRLISFRKLKYVPVVSGETEP